MRIALLLEYDGSAYHGWQIQPGEASVQAVVETALSNILDQAIRVHASGRTDAGVHARGQVLHFDAVEPRVPAERITAASHRELPEDVRIRASGQVAGDFHARFDAYRRHYRYRLSNDASILDRNQVWTIPYELETGLLSSCAELVLGKHDFASFCQAQTETENHVCEVVSAQWETHGNDLFFRISADRFLHHMVRMLVGSMVEVARGKWSLKTFKDLLEAADLQASTLTAAPEGLILEGVEYPGDVDLPWVS